MLIAVTTGAGLTPGDAAKLANRIAKTKSLILKGIMGYEGHVGWYPRRYWPALVEQAMSISYEHRRRKSKKTRFRSRA